MIKLYAGWVYRSGLQEFLATDCKCVIGIFEGRAAADVMPGESFWVNEMPFENFASEH